MNDKKIIVTFGIRLLKMDIFEKKREKTAINIVFESCRITWWRAKLQMIGIKRKRRRAINEGKVKILGRKLM